MGLSPAERAEWLNRPAMEPPEGVTPNFDNPDSYRARGLALMISMIILATLAGAMWLFTKIRISKRMLIEDYIIILAYCEFIVLGTYGLMMCESALGVHMWNYTVRMQLKFFEQYYNAVIVYLVTMCTLKVGIILQVLRAFVPTGLRNCAWWTGHAVLWINVLFYFSNVIIELKTCTPRAKEWDPTITDGHCIHASEVRAVIGLLNVITDLIIILLPQRVIWGLNLPLRRKFGLSALFLIGIFSMGCGCVQIYYGVVLSSDRADKGYKISYNAIWAAPEAASGFLVACLPVLPKFSSYISRIPAVSRFGTTVRSLLGRSASASRGSGRSSERDQHPPTIGRAGQRKGPNVTDIEFHELVATMNDGDGSKPNEPSTTSAATSVERITPV